MVIRPADHGIFAAAGAVDLTYKGYFNGGHEYQTNDQMRMFYFANETVVRGDNDLTGTPYGGNSGNGTNGTAGYVLKNQEAAPTYSAGQVDRITYATDVAAQISDTMDSLLRSSMAYFADDATAFYALGGATTSYRSEIDKCALPSETQSTHNDTLNRPSGLGGGCADNTTAGYQIGGYGGSQPGVDSIDRMVFSSGTVSTINDTSEEGAYWVKCTSDHDGRTGYATHGTSGDELDEIDFTTDTVSVSTPFTTDGSSAHAGLITDNGVAMYAGGGSGARGQVWKKVYSTGTNSTALADGSIPEAQYNYFCCENHESSIA